MRSRPFSAVSLFLAVLAFLAQPATSQSGGLQQVTCPAGTTTASGTTEISGTVYAPNGTDPLPGILVYIPTAAVAPFAPGVTCAVAGQPPSGSPLVGTTSATNGSFTITNAPVGSSIPLVIQSGRWRRQITIPAVSACTSNALPTSQTRFAQNQSEGDIPKIAVVTGEADSVECVLRKVGLADTEFTDSSGSGRVNLFKATGDAGAFIDPQTPSADQLLAAQSTLNGYDVLMLPCEGGAYGKPPAELGNLISYANAGGRVYASHYSYDWFVGNGAFNDVVNWGNNINLPDGTATVNTGFSQGSQLSDWLNDIGAANTTPAVISISTLRQNFTTVNPPTQAWLTLNNSAYNNPIMQFTFDAPVGSTTNACGRVLFNEYHVENSSSAGLSFPRECSSGPMTPQEKLLEYNLFDLTGDGSTPTLSPNPADFGTEPIGTASTSQKFLWTNNTVFPATVTSASASGDFAVTANRCGVVGAGASCEIDADFTPSALGPRTGTLTVVANTGNATAALTGTGVTPIAVSQPSLGFGLVDVGYPVSQTVTVTNISGSPVPLSTSATSGDYAVNSSCPASLSPQGSCVVTVGFMPSATGVRSATLNFAYAGSGAALASTALSGTGIDFTETVGPTSAQTVAGLAISMTSLTSPIAGFNHAVTVTCTTTAPASICTPVSNAFTPNAPVTDAVKVTTTSQYAVIGVGGLPRGVLLSMIVFGSGALLLRKRRHTSNAVSAWLTTGLAVLLSLALSASLSGCSGKQPGMNSPYTPAGTYAYTVTTTDGFLTHSATYTLVVTAQ